MLSYESENGNTIIGSLQQRRKAYIGSNHFNQWNTNTNMERINQQMHEIPPKTSTAALLLLQAKRTATSTDY
jgi:hypothetical protein